MQLYLDWIPYLFRIVDGQRYVDYMMETAQAERILPMERGRLIPTTESTYRIAMMIVVTIFSTTAVLTSPKINRKYAQLLIFFSAIFTFLPLVQYWTTGMNDTALLLAPIYTNVYGLLCVLIVYWRTRSSSVGVEKQKTE